MSRGTTALGSTNAAGAGSSSPRWSVILGGAIIVLAALAAYHNSFAVPFLFDDHPSIEDNLTIRHLWPIWKALSPSPASLVGGRPLVNLSLAVNYAWGGTGAWGYHALNLMVHILAGLALYGIVRRTLLCPLLRERFGASATRLALAVAVLWTVHPLQTEAVTYLSERCESLMGLFYLLTLYCFIRGMDAGKSGWWLALSVVACLLGMASKEVMVTAPVMVLLYDWIFVSGSFREAWARHRHLYLGLASSWLLLGYLMVGLHYRSVGYGFGITWWAYALTETRAVVDYLCLAFWPHPLVFDYGHDITIRHVADVWSYALILAILLAGVLIGLKRKPSIGFVGAWFFIILAPASSVVPVVGQPMAEHRMYLPLASVITMAVVGAFEIGKRLFHQRQGVVLGWAASGSVAMVFTFLTIQRNQDYKSEAAIWQDTAEKRPNNPRAYNGLGGTLFRAGNVPGAIEHYEQALSIQPDYAEAHNNMGLALARLGREQEAIQHFQQALKVRPSYADAHYNLGIALVQLGSVQEAIQHFQQALQIKPDYAEAHYSLGVAMIQLGRVPEAIGQYEQALRINPDYADAHYNFGVALEKLGRTPEAMQHYEQALRIKPDFAEAHNNLGAALARAGRLEQAIEHWEQAVRIQADDAEAHYNLAVALEKLGRTAEAVPHYRQALKLRPNFTLARNALIRLGVGQ
jgi:tetratricopeptide (TPR) repeat protein